MKQTVPVSQFTDNLNHILSLLTSPASPYAVADTPLSIVLMTPCPPLVAQQPAEHQAFRSVESTRAFRDAVLEIGREWKVKEAEPGNKIGWRIETLDLWNALAAAAGGEGDGLAPYYM
jgi:hypothetical protein